ncbi:hypothetical protein BABINDRAFT_159587 [Babjeviella inositovora NRRL Y-12698]|uniref:Structural maintenance of chromosomes protein n=1 Tax=Babjeviella inositovora NRRL Y-12698 TaxID=984486 RepID=A0A1E3QZQ8_9ASCO|nr:uncharacterized protein BABINDRAFT_159587 [Babjeviella inositovora NRRL Y-12698]ODQ83136.1 hypothetical protein BABINDRAFT_159587 [Babjeviella inositovora NRRL Y-12698]
MHIKKIVIQGFKTYKNTTIIDRFSPTHNVVVGRNGSGKSNFFAAIRFVLSDAYTHMTREERQGLIHEGSGTVMSAYVEIVFDNADRRFPIAKDEVVIRRTIGLKKDDYSLDARASSRADVMNLLESAGFSRSNPYYIVPQGRITSLTNSKDAERLQLLKEVSGANIFEVRLKESTKEMGSSNKRRAKIDEMLSFIEERLQDLQVEKNELKSFQALEKDKKVHEFALFDREFSELNNNIEALEINYDELLQASTQDLSELEKREVLVQKLAEDISASKLKQNVLNVDKEQADADINQLLQTIAEKGVAENEMQRAVAADERDTRMAQSSLSQLETLINARETALAQQKPEFSALTAEERVTSLQLSLLKSRQRALYSKQSRFSNFKTKAERDQWLESKISVVNEKIAVREEHIAKLTANQAAAKAELAQVEAKTEELDQALNGSDTRQEITALQQRVSALKQEYTVLVDARKALWREEVREKSICESLTTEAKKAQQLVAQTMDRAQAAGLAAVKRIASRLNLADAVYGPLGELIEVNEKYKTAVEVVAGNSLFHMVVDSDKTAQILMDELVREHAGRVTFMPLNRLRAQATEFPPSSEAVPLIRKLGYVPAVARAVEQVFGKTVVCVSLETGAELARAHKLSAITLDGDRADKKGVLSGGFRDHRRSRIDALRTQTRRNTELETCRARLAELATQITTSDSQITRASSELQAQEQILNEKIAAREPLAARIRAAKNTKNTLHADLDALAVRLEAFATAKAVLVEQVRQHMEERTSPFQTALTEAERAQLVETSSEIARLEANLDGVVTKLATLEALVSEAESELHDNLLPRRDELVAKLVRTGAQPAHVATELAHELQMLHARVEELQQAAAEMAQGLEDTTRAVTERESQLARANDQQALILTKLEKFQKTSEHTLAKKSLLTARRDELQKKIRELGVLPEEAFQRHSQMDADSLLHKLHAINQELGKYSHVNKKALEQFLNFTKQRDTLVERRAELETSNAAIEDLIHVLEQRKGAAIARTFALVSQSFSEIFEKLVPAGTGKLIMQREDDESDTVDSYTGVAISVSFNSKSDEQQRIEQLSGGQKSLCAIALILAIQKCDPAPFYLFDEIDANLDTQYRTAVAALIHELSANAQFICTTFRPEMLQVADKFYGVMFNNKVSTVSEIVKEEAMTFIDGQQQK